MAEEKKPGKIRKELEARRELGFSPASAGASAYRGHEGAVELGIGLPAYLASEILAGGSKTDFPSKHWGKNVQRIRDVDKETRQKIREFAESKGVSKVPVRAHPVSHYTPGGVEIDDSSLLKRILHAMTGNVFGKKVPGQESIGLAKPNLPHAFHEITHASRPFGSERLHQASIKGHGLSRSPMAKVVRAAGLVPALLPVDEDSGSVHKALREASPYIVAGTQAPMIAEEMRANVGAIRGLKKHKALTAKNVGTLAAAQSTYLARPIAMILGTILAKNLTDRLAPTEMAKESAAMPGNEMRQSGLKKLTDTAAWYQNKPPKPKSIDPKGGGQAKEMAVAKPPSSNKFYKDMLQALYQPELGFRQSVA